MVKSHLKLTILLWRLDLKTVEENAMVAEVVVVAVVILVAFVANIVADTADTAFIISHPGDHGECGTGW